MELSKGDFPLIIVWIHSITHELGELGYQSPSHPGLNLAGAKITITFKFSHLPHEEFECQLHTKPRVPQVYRCHMTATKPYAFTVPWSKLP